MGNRIKISPTFVPAPGATVTPNLIHRIIDEADVMVDTSGLQAGIGNIMTASNYTESAGTVQFNIDTAVCKLYHATACSEINVACDNFLTKAGLATWAPISAVSNVANVYKGQPAFFPKRIEPWGYHVGGDYNAGRYKLSGATGNPLTDSRSRFFFPFVTGDCKSRFPTFDAATKVVSNYTRFIEMEAMALFAQDSDTTKQFQSIEIVFKGPAEALVHASLSSSFNPNDLYAIYYCKEGSLDASMQDLCYQPVSWHGSAVTTYTRCQIPYGVIRKVHTSSGITMIQMQHARASGFSLPAQPYYVADIFFWGVPCL